MNAMSLKTLANALTFKLTKNQMAPTPATEPETPIDAQLSSSKDDFVEPILPMKGTKLKDSSYLNVAKG